MPTGMQVWSTVPVSNATADSNVNWAEGMAPSQVNDSSRAVMASAAKWVTDNSGSLVTSGTTSALTLATNQVESALTTGFTVNATLGTAVAAAATLAVDGLTAVPIFTSLSSASAVTTGSLVLGQITSLMFTTAITGTAQAWVVRASSPAPGSISPLLNSITNALASPVSLNSTASYFDGPSVSQGTSGTWFASGTITITDSANANVVAKLWDGTTIIAMGETFVQGADFATISLSGILTSPAGNIKISALDVTRTTGQILGSVTGTSATTNASVLTAIRIG